MMLRALAGGVAVVATLAAAGVALAAGEDRSDDGVLGPGRATVEVGIEHSAFDVDTIRVSRGTTVRFVLRNDDPILHELIVGDEDVHRRHENGTESEHPPRPGEVTVGPMATAETTYEFDEAGTFRFACHLPGHLAYGMVGVVEVVAEH
jgi:uncharacterized cupredoxin-like copper-binding protein